MYLRMGESVDEGVNRRVLAATDHLLSRPTPGLTDLIPSYASIYLEYDPAVLSERRLRKLLENVPDNPVTDPGHRVVIPVRYDGEDLANVAAHAGMAVEEVIRRHSSREYRVFALGFTPGFPFMGEVDEALRLPRLTTPRKRVEAHKVAIAERQTGIYPLPSPGGWRLLGSALEAVYDPHRSEPFLVNPGDMVTFVPAAGEPPEPVRPLELLPRDPRHPMLKVVEPGLLDVVVDHGRMMVGRFGLARSGPIDARSSRIANALVGNAHSAPVLELNVRGSTFEAVSDSWAAFAGWGVIPLLDGSPLPPFSTFTVSRGAVLSFPPGDRGARGYLAFPGGIESGYFLGSASVDVRGLVGRPLRKGDILGGNSGRRVRPGYSFSPRGAPAGEVTLRVVPGPQFTAEAMAALTSGSFSVSMADRMGVRLEGDQVPGGGILSEGNPLGAVQVSADGRPLLMLNDRGTIGGYAKPALIHAHDLPKAGQLTPGALVRFRPVDR